MPETIIELKNIGKSYGEHVVLKNVSFSVRAGEIHALLGENGAGKSTLMNILFGMPVIHSTEGYSGEIYFEDEKQEITSATDSIRLGIGMVHQEFMLLPKFTVTENIKLNREITKPNVLSRFFGDSVKSLETLNTEKMGRDARSVLDKLGIDVLKEDTITELLPVGFMQFVEIAREIDKENIKLLIFDEPTAVLTEAEVKIFFQALRVIADAGIAIIFISHKLDEVIKMADNITVLKDGEHVCTIPAFEADVLKLAELMVGRKFERIIPEILNGSKERTSTVALQIRDLHVDMPGEKIRGLNLDVYEGEILGIASLAGQGKIGIANGIMGIYPSRGEVNFFGKKLPLNSPREVLERGLSFVSENRKEVGLLLGMPIELNLIITAMQVKGDFIKRFLIFTQLNRREIRKNALDTIKKLDIRCKGPEQLTGKLSGGNQQKVYLGRALVMNPKLLFISEPTRGIDIGAKKMILEMLVALNRETGITIVITSSELAELRSIAGRVAVIFDGRLEGILKPGDSDSMYGLMLSGEEAIAAGAETKGCER